MNNIKQYIKKLPLNYLQGLRIYKILEFFDYPYLAVDITDLDILYLNYYVSGKDKLFSHILIEISKDKLNLLLSEDLTLKEAFDNSENGVVYYVEFDIKGNIVELGSIEQNVFNQINPIPVDYVIDNNN